MNDIGKFDSRAIDRRLGKENDDRIRKQQTQIMVALKVER